MKMQFFFASFQKKKILIQHTCFIYTHNFHNLRFQTGLPVRPASVATRLLEGREWTVLLHLPVVMLLHTNRLSTKEVVAVLKEVDSMSRGGTASRSDGSIKSASPRYATRSATVTHSLHGQGRTGLLVRPATRLLEGREWIVLLQLPFPGRLCARFQCCCCMSASVF